tara:strand:+ start:45 stop:476 length:432 start_codon:yes stop_codon:yes gene_type:complete
MQGVEHMVIGTSEERPGIRNGNALRSFLMDAFRYALSETLEHAWARAHPEKRVGPSSPEPSFKNPRPPSMSMSFSSSKTSRGIPSVQLNELLPRSRRGTSEAFSVASPEGRHTPEEPSGRESASAGSHSTKRWRPSDRLRSET